MSGYYALVNAENMVVGVECATPEWVQSWESDNPQSDYRYLPTAVEARDYAGIGFTWDETLERFIPPMPTYEGRWVYDPDEWAWIDLDAPKPDEGTEDGDSSPD
jgi:hypothetical protein